MLIAQCQVSKPCSSGQSISSHETKVKVLTSKSWFLFCLEIRVDLYIAINYLCQCPVAMS